MNSVELVKSICKERKIPISKLERECGFGNGYIGQLKNGTFPSDRLLQIADYLNVSSHYLMTGNKQEKPADSTLNTKDEKDIAKDLDNIMAKLSNKEDGPASFNGEDMSEETIELFKDELERALRILKVINKEKYNPNKNKK